MTKPHNPIDDLRTSLKEIAAYLGPDVASEALADEYGVTDIALMPPNQVMGALDLLHDIATDMGEPGPQNAGETAPMVAATEDPANDTGR
jgi:hypothetical protein